MITIHFSKSFYDLNLFSFLFFLPFPAKIMSDPKSFFSKKNVTVTEDDTPRHSARVSSCRIYSIDCSIENNINNTLYYKETDREAPSSSGVDREISVDSAARRHNHNLSMGRVQLPTGTNQCLRTSYIYSQDINTIDNLKTAAFGPDFGRGLSHVNSPGTSDSTKGINRHNNTTCSTASMSCQTTNSSDYQNGQGPSYVNLINTGSDSSLIRNNVPKDNCINLHSKTTIETHRRSLVRQATTDRQSTSNADLNYKKERFHNFEQ